MRILLAEDDPVVGDAFEDSFRTGYHTVIRTKGVEDTIDRLSDGDADIAILDVQLQDGTAWNVLDRIPIPHPPFSVSLVTAVDLAPPQRWAYVPLFRKPLGHRGLIRAAALAVPFEHRVDHDSASPSPTQNRIERVLLADEPPLSRSVSLALLAIAVVTVLVIPIREYATGAISASYTIVVLVIAAYAGVAVGLLGAVLSVVAYNFFTTPPYYTLEIASASLVINLIVFLVAAVLGAILIGIGRSLARRQATEAALSRVRLRLLSQTIEVPSNELMAVVVRIIKESVSEGTWIVVLDLTDDVPEWIPLVSYDEARLELRTIETRHGTRPVLLLPIDTNGLVLAASPTGTAISDLDRRLLGFAATELAGLAEKLDLLKAVEATELLQARDEAKNALLAAVSHDLRTPLASMKVAVTTVLEPELDLSETQRRRLLETVDSEVDRLGNMIDHLLDLSRLEGGTFRLSRDRVDLVDIARDAADRIRLSSGRIVQVESIGDANVMGDAVRLLEVITNLIDNSARYSSLGSPILARVLGGEGSVTVEVTDHGPGISEEEQKQLFQPFRRSSRPGSGSGLGLAISRSIVVAHGGTIDVVSDGAGTTISMTIPRRPLNG